mgnify:CR=1 FL=1
MINKGDPVLVFGAGSIGERHIGVLQKMGYLNIWVYRKRLFPLRNIDASTIHTITNLNQVKDHKPSFAIICTPTALHLEQTLFCVENNIPVLVEKPLSHSLAGFEELHAMVVKNSAVVHIAYMLRYHPFMQRIKKWVVNQEFGDLLNIQTYWGEYLPDWHPWEDYSTSYPACKELGGGVALTLSHDIDLVNWIAGSEIVEWHNLKNYRSNLDVNVEAGSDISMAYQNGITAHCHLNYFEKVARRYYRFILDNASIEVDYLNNTMTLLFPNGEIERQVLQNFDRNELFEKQLEGFVLNLRKSDPTKMIESKKIIEICNGVHSNQNTFSPN